MIELKFVDCGVVKNFIVKSDSTIEDALLEFVKSNHDYDYNYLDPSKCIFRYGAKILNSQIFINKNVNDVLKPGRNIIYVIRKRPYSGGEHICPYGCGRYIPNEYKGCTELLKDQPNYFS
jgi:adenine specific DNA methylase Mod